MDAVLKRSPIETQQDKSDLYDVCFDVAYSLIKSAKEGPAPHLPFMTEQGKALWSAYSESQKGYIPPHLKDVTLYQSKDVTRDIAKRAQKSFESARSKKISFIVLGSGFWDQAKLTTVPIIKEFQESGQHVSTIIVNDISKICTSSTSEGLTRAFPDAKIVENNEDFNELDTGKYTSGARPLIGSDHVIGGMLTSLTSGNNPKIAGQSLRTTFRAQLESIRRLVPKSRHGFGLITTSDFQGETLANDSAAYNSEENIALIRHIFELLAQGLGEHSNIDPDNYEYYSEFENEGEGIARHSFIAERIGESGIDRLNGKIRQLSNLGDKKVVVHAMRVEDPETMSELAREAGFKGAKTLPGNAGANPVFMPTA